jgi:hypothetical protein
VVKEALEEKLTDVQHHIFQAESLRTKVKSAADLIASVLNLDNGNALKVLAMESRAENAIMQSLTQKATRDAAAVKVLTVITLIYLPTTAVLNFFSTSFVATSVSRDGASRISVTSDWWISLAVSLPLTILTLAIWRFYVQVKIYGHHPSWWTVVHEYFTSLRDKRRVSARRSLMSHRDLDSL